MAEKAKKQTKRYGDTELSLIKGLFKDNDALAMALRKVFLQMPLDLVETDIIVKNFKGKRELFSLMRKCFLPELDPDAPINQLVDLWLTIEVKDKTIDELDNVFQSRQLLIDLLEQQLEGLEKIAKGETLEYKIEVKSLTDLKDKTTKEFFRNIMARNTLITHTEIRLQELQILANQEDETPEQTKERLAKDSSK